MVPHPENREGHMLTGSGRRPTTWWKAINSATCGTASHMAVEWIIQVSQEVLQCHVLDVAGLERHGGLPRFHGEALRHATQLITGSKRYRMLLVRERQLGEDNGGAVAGRQWLAEHVAAKRTCEPETPGCHHGFRSALPSIDWAKGTYSRYSIALDRAPVRWHTPTPTNRACVVAGWDAWLAHNASTSTMASLIAPTVAYPRTASRHTSGLCLLDSNSRARVHVGATSAATTGSIVSYHSFVTVLHQ